MKVEQNIERLKYLLTLLKMSVDELLPLISVGLTKPISRDQILGPSIELGHLKRIDKVFNKGIHYYLDPKSPDVSKDASIFFRSTTMILVSSGFLIAEIIKLTSRYFVNSIGWPLSLIVIGFLVIGVGYITFSLNKKYIQQKTDNVQ